MYRYWYRVKKPPLKNLYEWSRPLCALWNQFWKCVVKIICLGLFSQKLQLNPVAVACAVIPRNLTLQASRRMVCACNVVSLSSHDAKPFLINNLTWTRVNRRMHKFNRIRQVAPMCPYGRTGCRHLSNNIEPSVYGGDAPYGKLLWPFVIFGHAHGNAHNTADYCIMGIPHNTAI